MRRIKTKFVAYREEMIQQNYKAEGRLCCWNNLTKEIVIAGFNLYLKKINLEVNNELKT